MKLMASDDTIVAFAHTLVFALPIGAGLAFGGAAWALCFAQLAAWLCGGLLLAAACCDYIFSFSGRSLQPLKTAVTTRTRVAEAAESARSMCVFALCAAFPLHLLRTGRPTALAWTLADAQPEAPASLALYAAKLVAGTLLVDAYMYAKHRLLHSRALFMFHRQHHAFHNPTPFASFAVAPVEALLTYAPVLFLCIPLPAMRIWAQAQALWVAAFVALNLYLHAGYELRWLEAVLRLVGLNSSAFHNVHHSSGGRSNFGELMTVWDTLLGSGRHPDSEARKQKADM
jgi:sterol desaturase/sphingolipid hydroxylase (fatty acid hydroxylase superfamily)